MSFWTATPKSYGCYNVTVFSIVWKKNFIRQTLVSWCFLLLQQFECCPLPGSWYFFSFKTYCFLE